MKISLIEFIDTLKIGWNVISMEVDGTYTDVKNKCQKIQHLVPTFVLTFVRLLVYTNYIPPNIFEMTFYETLSGIVRKGALKTFS